MFHLLQKLLSFFLGHCGGSGGFILTVLFLLMFRVLIHSFFLQPLNLLRPIHTHKEYGSQNYSTVCCVYPSILLVAIWSEMEGIQQQHCTYFIDQSCQHMYSSISPGKFSLSGNIHTYVFLSNMYLLKIWLSQWLLFQI